MIDNPISWGVLIIVTLLIGIWFTKKCEEEIARYKKEEEEFWKNQK